MRLRIPLSDLDFIDNLFDTLNARLDGIDRRLEKLEAGQADLRTNQMNLIDALQGKKVITKPVAQSLRARIFPTR